MPDEELPTSDQSASHSGDGDEVVAVSVSLVAVEVWQILADRSTSPEAAPEWTNEPAGIKPLGLGPVDGEDDQFQVGIRCGAKDNGVSIQVEVSVNYKAEREDGVQFELGAFLGALDKARLIEIVNAALTDAAPYIREIVYSSSARLRPTDPIFLAGQPGRVTDAVVNLDEASADDGGSEEAK